MTARNRQKGGDMGIQVGIHPMGPHSFSERWEAALKARGARVKPVDLLGLDPLEQVRDCDGVMWHWPQYPHELRWAALPLLRVMETHLHLPVFPDMATCWHYDNKTAQRYLLEALRISHPRTWVFWRKADAMEWIQHASYPLVAKLSVGAGSTNVRLIRKVEEARRHVECSFSGAGIVAAPPWPRARGARSWAWLKRTAKRMAVATAYAAANRFPPMPDQTFWMPQKNYVLFQEFLPDNPFDTRVTVIGNRAFAYRRFNRPNDFRASGSGNFSIEPAQIDLRCIRSAFDAVRKLGSQSMAFDYLFRPGEEEPLVGEISYCYVDWMVEKCPGHWDSELQWHEGCLWPEVAHVEDFLARIHAHVAGRDHVECRDGVTARARA